MQSKNKVCFIIPAYNEEDSLRELYKQILDNIQVCEQKQLLTEYDILFVDDGSTDGSVSVMKELAQQDESVHYIVFRKNFGKSVALNTAFHNLSADVDVVVTMDADLQDDPAELENFLRKLDEGYDMVVGWKHNRLDPLEKTLPSKLFNLVTSRMSGLSLHDFDCGYKAFSRQVVDSIDLYGQLHRYIPVLVDRSGFCITEIPVHHNKRQFGKSKYGMERYLQGLFDFLTVMFLSKYSDRPMYLFGRLGMVSGVAGFIICAYMTLLKLLGHSIGGRPLLLLGVLLIILAVQFLSMGFLGNMMIDGNGHYSEARIKEKCVETTAKERLL